ncbi:MAG: RtcB family protein [Candidatus Omnitrophica bacterium]|nr:RtcB family protein [Candidatus Omnitrophota bacterium]
MNIPTHYDVIQTDGLPVKAWTRGVELEEEARQQLLNIARMPFVYRHIAAMPDVHWGIGATVGSVIPTLGAVIPAAVGVDIGCGMMAVKTTLQASGLPDNLKQIRHLIEKAVPHGRTNGGGRGDVGAWQDIPSRHGEIWNERFSERFKRIVEKHPQANGKNTVNHLGTLGTGNHFIEVCLDEQDYVWLMLHSGSRGIGNRFGNYFIELAKQDMKTHLKDLPDRDLAYLSEGTKHFDEYLEAVSWAQEFALANRQLMMQNLIKALKTQFEFELTKTAVNCHHNYLARERHFGKEVIITRKGAVRAQDGELGIIPGSMGARSFIVRGKGNADSFNSCSHGAGRRMSRRQAKKQISLVDHEKATAGVECRKDKDVLDESPAAYKSIESVMRAQEDLVEIIHTLKQIVCVKG